MKNFVTLILLLNIALNISCGKEYNKSISEKNINTSGTIEMSRGSSGSINESKIEVTKDGKVLVNSLEVGECGVSQIACFSIESGKIRFVKVK